MSAKRSEICLINQRLWPLYWICTTANTMVNLENIFEVIKQFTRQISVAIYQQLCYVFNHFQHWVADVVESQCPPNQPVHAPVGIEPKTLAKPLLCTIDWDNLCKSRKGSQVNLCPQGYPQGFYTDCHSVILPHCPMLPKGIAWWIYTLGKE